MFDLRYHVASLAAVFLALIVGILLGIGISDRGFVAESERSLLQDEIARRDQLLDAAARRETALAGEQKAAQALIEEAYPGVVRDLLRARRIALVFVGSMDARVRASIEEALAEAGAPPAVRVRAIKVPIDPRTLRTRLSTRPALASYAGPERLRDLGHALGRELVAGRETPLWDALASELVEERSGASDRPAAGVVVARSAKPQRGGTARFLNGLYAGLAGNGIPAVGVERLDARPSAIENFRKARLSSVDAIDTPAGRLALILLLAGGRSGTYGVKETAADDGVLPPLESVPRLAARSG
jgi:Copper transport outer membrane protein, MctB